MTTDEKLSIAIEALEKYADKNEWIDCDNGHCERNHVLVLEDEGYEIAQSALDRIKENTRASGKVQPIDDEGLSKKSASIPNSGNLYNYYNKLGDRLAQPEQYPVDKLQTDNETLRSRVKVLEDAVKWTPVSTPPETDGEYLVTVSDGVYFDVYIVELFHGEFIPMNDNDGVPIPFITAWMPLPEPFCV